MAGDLTRELSDLGKLARERPILIVGGALGLLLLAALVTRSQGGDEPVEGDGELEGVELDDQAVGGGTLTFPDSYASPSGYGVGGGAAYDPYGTDQETQAPTVEYTPDGCPLPKPAIPSGLAGKGDWACVSGSWAWRSKGTGAPPPSSSAKGPRITIPRGRRFIHYALRKGKLVGEPRTAGSAVTWKTSATPITKRTAGGSTIRVVQLKSGPLAGRWVGLGAGTWYPS